MRGHVVGSVLVVAALVASCGRIAYDPGEPAGAPFPLFSEDTLAPGPHALAARADGSGFVLAVAVAGPGAREPALTFIEMDLDGTPRSSTQVEPLDRWLTWVAVRPEPAGSSVFFQKRGLSTLEARRVAFDGSLVSSETHNGRNDANVAATPDGYAVVYRGPDAMMLSEVRVVFLGADLTQTGSPTAIEDSSANQVEPRIARSGDRLGVVWLDPGGTRDRVRFVAVDFAGTVLAPSRIVGGGTGDQFPNQLTSDGAGGFVLSWAVANRIGLIRLDPDGAPLWEHATVLPANRRESQDHAFVVTDDAVGVVWQSDDRTTLPQIEVAWYALATGAPVEGRRRLTLPQGAFGGPSIAVAGANVAATFQGTWANRRAPFVQGFVR